MKYADIIVDLSLEKLDRSYQYEIPEELEHLAMIGAQVIVPFGKGEREVKGCIIDISKEPKIEPERIKKIKKVIPNSTVIESELIRLAWWIRDTYGSTMNEALKTVIPVKQAMKMQEKKSLHLIMEQKQAMFLLEEFKRKKNTARVRLLLELLEEQVLDYRLVTQKLNISQATLKWFVEHKIITIETETYYRNPIKQQKKKEIDIVLNKEQTIAVKKICEDFWQGIKKTYLLFGVTGSGKTEVYLAVIEQVIAAGKQVIMLIPEIALTYQTVKRFYHRFGDRISILNSRMSKGERYDQYLRAKRGDIDIMIGPRSALFTPFEHLGLIIMDEEHENSYKSEQTPKYHARETAIERASYCGASVLLGSATPSIESWYRAQIGEYTLLTLKKRAKAAQLPKVYIEDLREEFKAKNYSIFSRHLQELIQDRLQKKEQIMLFLNRRGYAGFVSCRECGYVMTCPHCDISLKYHQIPYKKGKLLCHYCGYQIEIIDACPKCGSHYIGTFGIGTQQVEEMVKKLFPSVTVLRMDTDTTAKKGMHEKILSAFANHEADILIGTQMIVKGHDFKEVTLVGILAADMSMYANDFRASERTFQLLCQAAGRAGRGDRLGEVIIQTYHPEEYCITRAAAQDYEGFIKQELSFRQLLAYPPIASLFVLLIMSETELLAVNAAQFLANAVRSKFPERKTELFCLGPSKASLSKVNDIFRQVIYIKSIKKEQLKQAKNYLEFLISNQEELKKVTIQFDLNPMNGY